MFNCSVVIFGISDYREEILNRIKYDVNIVGYILDKEIESYNVNFFDYLKVININEINTVRYDYVIVAFKKLIDIEAACESLNMQAVNPNRVIIYDTFRDTIWNNPLKYYEEMVDKQFEQLVLGMSHARNGIYVSLLDKVTYSFASPSMDLFCHYQILNRVSEDKSFKNVKKIILEIPYYIFNYDLSKYKKFFLTKINYFEEFDNYHNYGVSQAELIEIERFKAYKRVFDRTYFKMDMIHELSYKDDCKDDSLFTKCKKVIYTFRTIYKSITNKDKVWKNIHQDTVNENIQLMDKIYKLIRDDQKLIVVISPFNPFFIMTHKKNINKMKKIFYEILGKYNNIEIIDEFYDVKNTKSFLDHCHLKRNAAYSWSISLNKKIKEKDYNDN